MTLSSSNLNDIGDLYENIVSSDVEQLDEEPYIPRFDPKSLFTKSGIEAEKKRKAELEKRNKPAAPKTKPATETERQVQSVRQQSDIGYRVGQGIVGALRDLPGGVAAQLQGKDSPELQRQRARGEKLKQLIGTGTLPVNKPETPATAKPGPSGKPGPAPAPGTRPPVGGAPGTRPPANRPAPAATKPAPSRPAAPAQTGDRTKDLATWAKANERMISKVGTPQQRAILSAAKGGTQMPAPRPLSADIGDIKGAIQRSQERQAAQSGPMYSSPDVKSKMTLRTQRVLGLKDSYDIVLDYLLSQGHVDTLEEALYVMMEMDSKCIQSIVEGVMPEPIDPTAHKEAQRLARQQGKVRALEAGATTPGEQKAAQSKLRGPQLPGV